MTGGPLLPISTTSLTDYSEYSVATKTRLASTETASGGNGGITLCCRGVLAPRICNVTKRLVERATICSLTIEQWRTGFHSSSSYSDPHAFGLTRSAVRDLRLKSSKKEKPSLSSFRLCGALIRRAPLLFPVSPSSPSIPSLFPQPHLAHPSRHRTYLRPSPLCSFSHPLLSPFTPRTDASRQGTQFENSALANRVFYYLPECGRNTPKASRRR